MPSQMLNTKAVEKFLPGTAMEGPLNAAGPLGFYRLLEIHYSERKRSFDNCQQEETSAGWMNLHVTRSWSSHTVQTISTNVY
jgi:hypothetical protein